MKQETKLLVPPHQLEGIVVFGDVRVSPALMHCLADNGQSLAMLGRVFRWMAAPTGHRATA